MNYNNKINTYVIEMAQKDNYNQKLLLFYFIYKNYNFVKKKSVSNRSNNTKYIKLNTIIKLIHK